LIESVGIIGLGNMGMGMAKECGMPMFTTNSAYELFQAGKLLNPDEDNWTVIKILENIAGVEVKKSDSKY
jgi:putative dehydrogenase